VNNNISNQKFCTEQIERMAGLNFFPTAGSAIIELRDALVKASETRDDAKAVVSAWLESNKERPTPSDIASLARSLRPPTESLPPACSQCAELAGYIRTTVRIERGVFAGELRDAVVTCSCPRGLALKGAYVKVRADRDGADVAQRGDLVGMAQVVGRFDGKNLAAGGDQ